MRVASATGATFLAMQRGIGQTSIIPAATAQLGSAGTQDDSPMTLIYLVICILLLSVACSVSGFVIITPLLAAVVLWILIDPELEAHTTSPSALVWRLKERAQVYWGPAVPLFRIVAKAIGACAPVWIAWLVRSAPFTQARALLSEIAGANARVRSR
jgi:hypothetical protein